MSAKEQKTRQQLRDAITQEVRQHPEWNDILDVAITQSVQAALHSPNWDAAFTMDGPRVAPEPAFRLILDLQNKFDLT
jgi:hypothetical protein